MCNIWEKNLFALKFGKNEMEICGKRNFILQGRTATNTASKRFICRRA